MTLSQAILSDLMAEIDYTKRLLEVLPESKADWKPHAKSMSLGQLAGHLAEAPAWVPSMMEPELDFESMLSGYEPYVSASPAELVQTLDENVRAMRPQLAGRDDAFMLEEWVMRHGEKVLMRGPRHEVIRSILLHHGAHHRGQLTVYLRLLEVPVPATYGSTADFQVF